MAGQEAYEREYIGMSGMRRLGAFGVYKFKEHGVSQTRQISDIPASSTQSTRPKVLTYHSFPSMHTPMYTSNSTAAQPKAQV